MAIIKWVYPIESIHGALKKGVFGAAMRKTKNARGEQPNYIVHYGVRSTPVTSRELEVRERFAAVQALVKTRKDDPILRMQDQQDFAAQTECKTLTQYLWKVAGDAYDQSLIDAGGSGTGDGNNDGDDNGGNDDDTTGGGSSQGA